MESSKQQDVGLGIIAKFVLMKQAKDADGAENLPCSRCSAGIWWIEERLVSGDARKLVMSCFCDVLKKTTWESSVGGGGNRLIDCSALSSVGSEVGAMAGPVAVDPVQVRGLPEFR
jgi:hypothetical protein